ncbi:MAG: hypothetical protein ACFB0B_08660 [Thermonemataceae bacterium]
MIEPTHLSANDFLHKYFEFKAMEPNLRRWSLRRLKHNEPRYYRLKALLALLKAFELGSHLRKDFTEGGFLKIRDVTDFLAIYEDIEQYIQATPFEKRLISEEGKQVDRYALEAVFQGFMDFLEVMHNTLKFNSGWLEAGCVSARYSIRKTEEVLKSIDRAAIQQIEKLVCKVIDPNDKKLSIAALVDKFDYPDIDLRAIDAEYY